MPKKSTIVDSALMLFADRGYDGVSLRDIAKHAGVPLSTLAHHYSEKKILYDEAVTRAFESSAAVFLEAVKETGSIDLRLRHALESLIPFLMQRTPEQRLIDRALLDEHVMPDITPSQILDENRQQMRRFFTEVSEHNKADYGWDELSEIFVGFLYGLVKFRQLHAQVVAAKIPSSQSIFVRRLTDFFLAGIKA
jgi:AcrR family transcriptional regulator